MLLWLGILAFAVFFSYLASMRHENFHSRRIDLGNMEQSVWNLTHGNGFVLTDPFGDQNIPRLAVHADFLLIVIAPLYMLWSDPKLLVILQAVIMALGALPVFWIAKDRLKSEWLALLFAAAYLLYPPVQRMSLHDFHAVALSMTFLLFAYRFMDTKRYGLFLLFAVLAGMGKENIWLVVGLMGLWIAARQGKPLFGSMVAVAGFGAFYVLYWLVMPQAQVSGQHFALTYLSDFGESQSGIVAGILRQPVTVMTTLLRSDRLAYYATLLFPLAFLPLVSPVPLLFALPGLLMTSLSSNGLMRVIDYQYTSDITPFLFVSAIAGFAAVIRRKEKPGITSVRTVRVPLIVLLVTLSVGVFTWGEIPLTARDRFYYFVWPIPSTPLMRQVERTIDSRYTVSATNDIGAHFARRKFLYNFPVRAKEADYAVVRLGDTYAWPSGYDQMQAVVSLLRSPDHELIAHEGDFYAFRRK